MNSELNCMICGYISTHYPSLIKQASKIMNITKDNYSYTLPNVFDLYKKIDQMTAKISKTGEASKEQIKQVPKIKVPAKQPATSSEKNIKTNSLPAKTVESDSSSESSSDEPILPFKSGNGKIEIQNKPSSKKMAVVEKMKLPLPKESSSSESSSDEPIQNQNKSLKTKNVVPNPVVEKKKTPLPVVEESSSSESSSDTPVETPNKTQTKSIKKVLPTPDVEKKKTPIPVVEESSSSESSSDDPVQVIKPQVSANKTSNTIPVESSSDSSSDEIQVAPVKASKKSKVVLDQSKAKTTIDQSNDIAKLQSIKRPATKQLNLSASKKTSKEETRLVLSPIISSTNSTKVKQIEVEDSSSSSESDTPLAAIVNLVSKSTEKSPKKVKKLPEVVTSDVSMTKKKSKKNKSLNTTTESNNPIKRINESVHVPQKFSDNSFEAKSGSWGDKANSKLKNVKGKDFKREKSKGKKGSYSGGAIDVSVHSTPFESE